MAGPPVVGGGRRVVVASDSFSGSLSSTEVADAVRLGVIDVAPSAVVEVVPVADGGEGTVAAALSAGWRPVPVHVSGPTGGPVDATLAVAPDGGTALVELADACGRGRLPGGRAAPLTASSRGVGEVMRAALGLGVARVVVGLGGSASTDGGAGLLRALGARVLDGGGQEVAEGGAALLDAVSVDLGALDPRWRSVEVVVAADVDNPLLGPRGAATVFGPQKGATPADVDLLERALTHWVTLLTTALPRPTPHDEQSTDRAKVRGAGAAGGVGFALLAVLGATVRPGIDVVLDLVGLDDCLLGADLVVTGEGSLDAQTIGGKAVAGVARRAAAAGTPVVAVCGRCRLSSSEIAGLGLAAAYPLTDLEPDPERSLDDAANLVRHTAARVAAEWLSPSSPG